MDPLFLGSHPAMDFLNTRLVPDGQPVELIGDGAAYASWLEAAGMLGGATAAQLRRRFGIAALDAAAAEARLLREWMRDWLGRWQEAPRADYAAELRRVNAVLARAACHREVVPSGSGLQLRERWRPESAEGLIAPVAAHAASLVAEVAPALVKRCAGPGCSLWFVDRTKARKRIFCSASACGNRAKVAAFRQRRREAER